VFNEKYLGIPILRDFTVEELQQVLNYAQELRYEAEDVVFRQGDGGREIFIVVDGKLRFEFEHPEKEGKRILSYATFGMLFGEISFLLAEPRTATVIAHEPSVLLSIGKPDVQKLIDLYPDLAATFYHAVALELAHKLRAANPRIT